MMCWRMELDHTENMSRCGAIHTLQIPKTPRQCVTSGLHRVSNLGLMYGELSVVELAPPGRDDVEMNVGSLLLIFVPCEEL